MPTDRAKETTLPTVRLEALLRKEALLDHLEANGVDNWEGYSVPSDEEED